MCRNYSGVIGNRDRKLYHDGTVAVPSLGYSLVNVGKRSSLTVRAPWSVHDCRAKTRAGEDVNASRRTRVSLVDNAKRTCPSTTTLLTELLGMRYKKVGVRPGRASSRNASRIRRPALKVRSTVGLSRTRQVTVLVDKRTVSFMSTYSLLQTCNSLSICESSCPGKALFTNLSLLTHVTKNYDDTAVLNSHELYFCRHKITTNNKKPIIATGAYLHDPTCQLSEIVKHTDTLKPALTF